jgi:site-specific DNA-methyltransferase (adenine-specific)
VLDTETVTIGDATLYRGDCLTWLSFIEPRSVRLVWTDPPYGNGNADDDFLSRRQHAMKDGRATASKAIANDGAADMARVIDGMLDALPPLLTDPSAVCVCCAGGGPTPVFAWLAERMNTRGLRFFHSVIWDKANPGIGWRYRRQHEMVIVGNHYGGALSWNEAVPPMPNILRYPKPREIEHTNEKPLALVERMLVAHTMPGDLVLDPFMGSGTTGVAALKHGRRFIGIELDPEHFNTACQRIDRARRQPSLLDPYEQNDAAYTQAEFFD